ncbi:1-phosphatidylinositol 4,5-bisphosphate phosphodiesterase delta-4 [Xenotaenia resolanae]|uniref:Phosphoinositide phospholipase C n=1 Tax=Xenotaenia resolanae TaxID=208358 RepID=A0ABV0WLS2_9TELE
MGSTGSHPARLNTADFSSSAVKAELASLLPANQRFSCCPTHHAARSQNSFLYAVSHLHSWSSVANKDPKNKKPSLPSHCVEKLLVSSHGAQKFLHHQGRCLEVMIHLDQQTRWLENISTFHVLKIKMELEGSCVQDDPHVKLMMAGSTLRKVKSRSWKRQRHFRLLEDGLTIWYKSRWAGKGHSTFSVMDVEVVREGHQSEVMLSIAEEFPAELCFTLVFHGRQGNLDLVADSPEEAQAWIQGVRKLIHKAQTMDEQERQDQWVQDWFQKADKNKDGKMNFKEVKKLLKMMNVEMNEDHALHLFTMADKWKSGSLEIEQFVHFYKMLTQRDEVWKVFQDYSGDGEKLTLEELENFLRLEQGEGDQSSQHALELIQCYEPSETAVNQSSMSQEGFEMYLCSQEGSIFKPELLELHQDMSQPLSHYFISSSHNTYLLEDQLRGQSSLEAYIQALKRGCRCVEVDCWDGSDGEPVVYHGHTLTSKILFKDIISTLKEYAFQVSRTWKS